MSPNTILILRFTGVVVIGWILVLSGVYWAQRLLNKINASKSQKANKGVNG